MTPSLPDSWSARSLAAASLLFLSFAGQCQESEPQTVHWAYASFFGTGWYTIADQRSSFILNIAPRKSIGEAGFDEHGQRTIAWTLRLPMSIGVNRFDVEDIPGLVDFDNFAAASVGFAADADIPLNRRFSIRPGAELGYGRVLGERNSAWTYRAEVKSRYNFGAGVTEAALLGGAGVVGYEPNTGRRDSFTFLTMAAEFERPVDWLGGDDQTVLYWHLAYTEFLDEVEYEVTRDSVDTVTNYWQIGAAIGKRDRPLQFGILRFDRLGLAYDISPSGDFRGVKLVFRSWYDR